MADIDDQESEPKDPELRLRVRQFRTEVEQHLAFLEDLLARVEAGEFGDGPEPEEEDGQS